MEEKKKIVIAIILILILIIVGSIAGIIISKKQKSNNLSISNNKNSIATMEVDGYGTIPSKNSNDSTTLKEKIEELAIRKETEVWDYTGYKKYTTLQSSGNEIILVTYTSKYDRYEHYYMLIEVNTKENSIIKHTDVFPGNEGFIESMYFSNWKQ